LSFFPVYVSQFYDPSFPLPRQVVVGLPISVFMLVWALAMPWAGAWCDRVGYKQAFGFGAAVTTLGLVLTAQAGSMAELLLWRSITAVGYGTVFITTQTFITNNTEPKARTRAMGMFLATFFAGSLSGAAIGGILVDRLGYRMTFILSGLLSAAAVLFVVRFLAYDRSSLSAKKGLEIADFRNLLGNKQFAAITFLAAIPSKIALTGFLYFSIPLYLKLLGHNQSVTGRVMMGYGLAMVLLAPVIATLADRFENRWRFVMIGGYAGAIAMAAPYFLDDIFGVLLSVTFLGIAHAVGVSSQLTLIGDRCQETVKQVGQATTTGIFRMTERAGNVLGPLILGGLIAVFDFKGAFVGVALFTAATTTFFLMLLLWFDRSTARAKPA
jgi:MFS family permease